MRAIAAKRAAKYRLAVGMMQWPLFVTLTVPHDEPDPLHSLRRLRRGFGALRRQKLWTVRVKGGVAGLEINSRHGTFHPHLHAVLDCRWLAWYVMPPQHRDSKATVAAKCLAASQELGMTWARCLKVQQIDSEWCGTVYKVKRTCPGDITSEILKYSVKGSELLKWPEAIGPIIRALGSTRLVTSFGSLYGKKLIEDGTEPKSRDCEKCGCNEWMPDVVLDAECRRDREKRERNRHSRKRL